MPTPIDAETTTRVPEAASGSGQPRKLVAHIPSVTGKYVAHNPAEAQATHWLRQTDCGVVRQWNTGRSRGLADVRRRVGDIDGDLRELLPARGRLRVVEVGCGYGRSLFELGKVFPGRLELHGINREPEWDQELAREFAHDAGLLSGGAPKDEPTIHVHDIDRDLPFASNSVNYVYSIATLHYVRDKLGLLGEVQRVLVPGGRARIDLCLSDPALPPEFRHRLEIWRDGHRVDVYAWLASLPGFELAQRTKRPALRILKASMSLHLPAPVVSFDLARIHSDWWGRKSIYRLPSADNGETSHQSP